MFLRVMDDIRIRDAALGLRADAFVVGRLEGISLFRGRREFGLFLEGVETEEGGFRWGRGVAEGVGEGVVH